MADPLPYPPRMNIHFLPISTLRSPRHLGENSAFISDSKLCALGAPAAPFVLRLQDHSKIENRKSKMLPRSHCVHAISRYFTLFHAISRYFTLFHAISRYFTLFHAISRYFTLFHAILQGEGGRPSTLNLRKQSASQKKCSRFGK